MGVKKVEISMMRLGPAYVSAMLLASLLVQGIKYGLMVLG
jgi:hypothetical protein